MKPFGAGVLLTPAQTIRLAALSSIERDRQIELIAQHIRSRSRALAKKKDRQDDTPQHWYR